MKLPRRTFLNLAAGLAALPAASRIAWAQAYPRRPVRLTVPTAAGSSPDITARLMGQWLSERLGQPFIIENRPGAGGNIATETVARAAPDGYSLLLVTPANAINTTLYDNLNFNFIRDIAPIASIIRVPLVLVLNSSVPANTVPELIAFAKANPGKLNLASASNGTPQHVSGELFKMMANVNMLHVAYRSEPPAMADLIGGQMQVMFDTMPAAIEHIRAGQIRPLAVTTAMRQEVLPDVPPLGDFVPGYEASAWYGLGGPKNTPVEIVGRLNNEINAGLTDPKLMERIAGLGATVFAGSPADFGKLIAEETEKWAKVVKFSGAKPD
jgi:tripartite-type tricarboxylate transporter receptor subunit TctC